MKKRKILAVIPTRYSSSRFPGKPLVDIAGKSMIHRVYMQAKKASLIDKVVIATDDERIYSHITAFGGDVVMTSQRHHSGTDRCAEVVRMRKFSAFDTIINIQGDEPLIDPGQIDMLADLFIKKTPELATLVSVIDNNEDLINPNIVKVILGENRKALYFSRTPIPFVKGVEQNNWLKKYTFYRHVGIYGYSHNALLEISRLDASHNEKAESLEQLRWLDNGMEIYTEISNHISYSIDSPEDVQKVIDIIQ